MTEGTKPSKRLKILKVMFLYGANRVANTETSPPELGEKVINAAILAGLAFFKVFLALLAGDAFSGARLIMSDPKIYLISGAVYAGFEFFQYMALARGIQLHGDVTTTPT